MQHRCRRETKSDWESIMNPGLVTQLLLQQPNKTGSIFPYLTDDKTETPEKWNEYFNVSMANACGRTGVWFRFTWFQCPFIPLIWPRLKLGPFCDIHCHDWMYVPSWHQQHPWKKFLKASCLHSPLLESLSLCCPSERVFLFFYTKLQ